MKRKYNTLNEEMNRMKSLFGESRLYGNLEDKKENIITEQYRFFSDLTSLYKVTLKSFDDLGNFTKFINTEIRNVDDIIKHLDEFEALWRVVLPNVTNWTGVKNNLIKLKQLSDSDKLKGIPEDVWVSQVLPGFPEKGGMRDIVNDMWRIANNKNPYLPQKVETRIVTTDPNTGTLLIGTKNEGGNIVYKNEEGKVVMVEKDPDIKVDDSRTNIKPDIEDVDFIEVKPDTPLDDLNGKTVAASEENIKNVVDAVGDKIAGETKNGNKVVFTITGEGEEGVRAAQEMMDKITSNKGGTSTGDEVLEDMTQEVTERTGENPEVVKNKLQDKLKNFAWGTRFWWNPTTYVPSEKWLAEKWGQNLSWKPDANSWMNRRGAKIIFRLFVVDLGTYEIVKTGLDPDRDFFESGKNNIFVHIWNDLTRLAGMAIDGINSGAIKDMSLQMVEDALMNIGGTDIKIVKQNVLDKAMNEILYINSKELDEDGQRKSMMTCTTLSKMTTDDEVVKSIIKKHADKGITVELERLKGELGGTGSEKYREARDMMEQYFDTILKTSLADDNLKQAIGEARMACEEAVKEQSEIDDMRSEEYTVTIEGGSNI